MQCLVKTGTTDAQGRHKSKKYEMFGPVVITGNGFAVLLSIRPPWVGISVAWSYEESICFRIEFSI